MVVTLHKILMNVFHADVAIVVVVVKLVVRDD